MDFLKTIVNFLQDTGFAIVGEQGGLAVFQTVVMLAISGVLI